MSRPHIRRAGQRGFTLIEMLVVIAILGILATVAIPNLISFQNHGKTEAAAAELSIVQTAVSVYTHESGGSVAPASGITGDGGVLSQYLTSPLHGTYSWDSQGHVTQTAYP